MNKLDYLRYLDGKEKDNPSIQSDGENGINSDESIIDELIEKMLKSKEIFEDKNNIINYKMNFDLKV